MQSFREMQARDIAMGCESGLAALPLGECGETAVAIVAHAASGAPRRLRSRVNLDQASTSASLRSSSSNHAATEDGDEAAGADGGVDVDGGRAHKSCKGCKRVYGKSRNFFAPTEFVQWGFSNGRGNYCAGCYITWRTCMSHSHPLGMLESWIYMSEENTEKWTLFLVASIMLRFEDTQPRLANVTTRCESIKFIFRLLCLPLRPSVVVSVAYLFRSPQFEALRSKVTAENLVTLCTDDGYSAGVWLPVPDVKAHPIARLGSSTTYLNSQIFTSSASDAELVAEHFGTEAPSSGLMLCDQDDDAGLDEAPGCKTQSKVDVVLERCMRGLAVFERVSWSAGKESWFTKPLSKLHGVKDEASQQGKKDIVDRCASWTSVLNNVKCFLKKHREYEKSNKGHAKHMGLASALLPMIEGLATVCKIAPAESLELFRFKIMLFQALEGGSKPGDGSAKPSSLADALEALVTAGLFGQIKRQEAANNDPRNPSMYTMDTSLWLDSILQQGLPMSLASWSRGLAVDAMADDEIVNALRGPLDDLERAVRLLQAFPAEKQDVDKATRVLRGVHALVAHCVQPGATHITSLKHAVTFIGSGDLEQCFSQLSGASLFRHAWEAAKARVQRSAQDQIADAHVRKSISHLRDTRMPRLIEAPPGEASVDRGSARVEQCGLVFDMTVASVLVENLECASEALGIWSPVAMEEAGHLLAEWASTFIEALDVVSMTVTGRMQQVCARSWLAGYLQDSAAVDCGKDLDERVVEATLDIPPSTLRGFVPEGELKGPLQDDFEAGRQACCALLRGRRSASAGSLLADGGRAHRYWRVVERDRRGETRWLLCARAARRLEAERHSQRRRHQAGQHDRGSQSDDVLGSKRRLQRRRHAPQWHHATVVQRRREVHAPRTHRRARALHLRGFANVRDQGLGVAYGPAGVRPTPRMRRGCSQ